MDRGDRRKGVDGNGGQQRGHDARFGLHIIHVCKAFVVFVGQNEKFGSRKQ